MMVSAFRCLIVLMVISLSSCAAFAPFPSSDAGHRATTVVSKNFQGFERIAVFPFHNSGSRSGMNYQAADRASLKIMEMGYTIVERTQLETVLSELRLNYTGALSASELKEVGRILSIDAIVFGTIEWMDVPGTGVANSFGVFSKEGYTDIQSVTVRFVDVETGAVIINSFCCRERPPGGGIVDEIAASIETKLSLQWGKTAVRE